MVNGQIGLHLELVLVNQQVYVGLKLLRGRVQILGLEMEAEIALDLQKRDATKMRRLDLIETWLDKTVQTVLIIGKLVKEANGCWTAGQMKIAQHDIVG